jgi:hypothetical protein
MLPNTGICKKVKTKVKSTSVVQVCDTIQNNYITIDANNGVEGRSLSDITFSGFDKPATSLKESFFVVNNTDCTLAGMKLEIEYLTTDGRQLHKRELDLKCDIPSGETRKIDVKSWDTQKSFRYYKSAESRKSAMPFKVKITLISCSLIEDFNK